jgi:hypothetical protein
MFEISFSGISDTNHDSLLQNTTYIGPPRLRYLFHVVQTQTTTGYCIITTCTGLSVIDTAQIKLVPVTRKVVPNLYLKKYIKLCHFTMHFPAYFSFFFFYMQQLPLAFFYR